MKEMLAIYCRISKDEQNGKNPNRSIENQKDMGVNFAKKEGMDYKFYIDANLSGTLKNKEDRPAFNEMLGDIVNAKLNAVFATNQDRLERNPKIRILLKETLKENNVKLFFSNGEEDLNNPENELLGDLISSINQYYVRVTSGKIKNVLKNNAINGKVHGMIPFGYKKDQGNLMIIDDNESQIVKRIYNLSLSGIGINKIAEIFNKEKIPTRYNKVKGKGTISIKNKYTGIITEKKCCDITWSGKTIGGIIKGTLYKGERWFSGQKYQCPVIIERGYWHKVNDNLKNNRNNSGKVTSHKYMLKNVIECGGCSRNMYGRTRLNKKDNYYMCSGKRYKNCECKTRSINIDVLEEFIWSRFFKKSELLKLLEVYFEKGNLKLKDIEIKINGYQTEITKLLNKRKRAIKLVINEVLTENDVKSELSQIDSFIKDLEIKILNLKEQSRMHDNSDQMIKQLTQLKNQTSFNDKVVLINKYIKRIKICSNDDLNLYSIRISFNLNLKTESYVMDYNKRVPYVDVYKSITLFYKSFDSKKNIKDITSAETLEIPKF
jgi:site-specific DNA recombinase